MNCPVCDRPMCQECYKESPVKKTGKINISSGEDVITEMFYERQLKKSGIITNDSQTNTGY